MANNNQYQQKAWHNYREDTTASSTHSLDRHAERLDHLNLEQQAIVSERAAWAAAKYTDNVWGVTIFLHPAGDVHAVVSGRTGRTLIVTDHGQRLHEVSKCNKYAVHPEAVIKGRRF